jgi:myo-inositol-1(or 4)-monophosphatase
VNDLNLAVAAARAGGAIVAQHFGRRADADLKGRNNPVTEADRASERAIIDVLRQARPDDTIFAEESGLASKHATNRRWIVDPLDGTVNFVHGIPQVSVSIALYAGNEPLVGVVLDVMQGDLFTAAAAQGASLNGAPIRVSETSDAAHAVVSTGFPYDHHDHPVEYVATVAAMLARVNGIRRIGSAALDLAWVAAGRFEAHWEYLLSPWDVAAGTLLVREAGGIVTNAAGIDLVPEDRVILASNTALHETFLGILQSSIPPHLQNAATAP